MERKIEDWDRRKREIVDDKRRKDEEEKLKKSRQGVELSNLAKATTSGEGDKKSKPEGKIVEEIKEDGKKVEEKKEQVTEEFEPLLPVRRKEDIQFSYLAGTIAKEDISRFKMMIFRGSRGNAYPYFVE